MRNFFLTRYRKHKKHLANLMMAAAAAAGIGAGSAQASSISIINADFENTPFGSYTAPLNGGPVDGWTNNNALGGGIFKNAKHAGNYGGYLNSSGTMFQQLGTNWAAGTYTLNFYGAIQTGTNTTGLTVSMQNGDTNIDVTAPYVPTITSTFVGESTPIPSVTPLVFTILPSDTTNIGHPIKISLARAASSGQVYFDDFTFDFQAAPEPNSLVLFGAGSFIVGSIARRRRMS